MLYSCEKHSDCIVVYDISECPMCALQEEKAESEEDLYKQLADMSSQVEDLENEIDDRKGE